MKADLRLICITPDYPPQTGGVARYLSALQSVSNGAMEVWVPLEEGKGESFVPLTREEGIPRNLWTSSNRCGVGKREESSQKTFPFSLCTFPSVRGVRFWWRYWPKWLPLIARCLEVPKDRILFVSHVLPVGTAAWIASFFGGADYIILFHGTDIRRIRSGWKRWLVRQICFRAKTVFCNSRATADAVQRIVSDIEPVVMTPGVSLERSDIHTTEGSLWFCAWRGWLLGRGLIR